MSILAGAAAALVLLSPWLFALVPRLLGGERLSEPVFWRSSVAGLDVLGLLAPNPSHPAMRAFSDWFASRPGGFIENVGSIPIVVWLVIGVAAWRYGAVLPRWWVGVSVAFGLLSLGPFVHVADSIPTFRVLGLCCGTYPCSRAHEVRPASRWSLPWASRCCSGWRSYVCSTAAAGALIRFLPRWAWP